MRIFPLEIGRHCLLPEAKIVLEYGRESLDSVDLECVVLGNIETIQAGMVYTGKERVMAQRVGSIEKGDSPEACSSRSRTSPYTWITDGPELIILLLSQVINEELKTRCLLR